ncbi:hypothetical protein [Acidovorax sp. NB1]|uniref:hypothetical protein n=1 Tax=Acidovorax sp. NB1 TaxID=1943571 RepID=UPI0010CE2973|nr:hypothetical protein [Acidovorax sp. NB1]GDY37732.1 hypothetical protein ACINB_36240 [Acidovorax sp. NB1]
MSDRELLELAAKAAGQERSAAGDLWSNARGLPWDPLNDDGDALRLAVKLKLHLGLESHTVSAWQSDKFGNFQTEVLSHRGDEAATRRAIVRAAAEIGKAMP